MFYLDDGTLRGRGPGPSVERGEVGGICVDPTTEKSLLAAAPGLRVTSPNHAALLGSPLPDMDSISNTICEKIYLLQIMGDRLQYLHSHDAILLLRHSFALPKLLYVLHTSPCFLSPK